MRFVLTFLLCLTPALAQAIIVKNLTYESQAIEVEPVPGSISTYVIHPFDSTVIAGRGRVRMAGDSARGVYAYNRDRFVIWPEAGLVHQQRMKKGRN